MDKQLFIEAIEAIQKQDQFHSYNLQKFCKKKEIYQKKCTFAVVKLFDE